MSRHLFTRIFLSLFRERERHANSSSSPLPFFYYRTRSQHLFIWPSSSVGTTAGVSQFSGRHLCHRPMRPQHTFEPNVHLSYANIKTVKGLVPNDSDWVDCCYNKKGKEQGTYSLNNWFNGIFDIYPSALQSLENVKTKSTMKTGICIITFVIFVSSFPQCHLWFWISWQT